MIHAHDEKIIYTSEDGVRREVHIGSPEGFEILSDLWLRSGWDRKYVYSFSWLGRPIIQLPEDLVRLQEVIYAERPDVIVETGVAHGGGLVFYASILEAIGSGRVIGVELALRPANRKSIEDHFLSNRISLIEGSSVDLSVVERVRQLIPPESKVMVILDSNHTRAHVLSELIAYAELVSIGSYFVVCDGIMQNVVGAPRTDPSWSVDNPLTAISEFLAFTDTFESVEPPFMFNEGEVSERITYWPRAFLRRIR